MTKIFRFEDFNCNEEIFKKFITLAKKKKGDVVKYMRDLVSFEFHEGDPIKDDDLQKY